MANIGAMWSSRRHQDKRDKVVEGLVKTTLEKDPIDNLDHLATVMGHIQRVVTPRTSHSAITVPWNLNVNSTASGAGSGSGTGGSPRVICIEDHHSKRASRHHEHHEMIHFWYNTNWANWDLGWLWFTWKSCREKLPCSVLELILGISMQYFWIRWPHLNFVSFSGGRFC